MLELIKKLESLSPRCGKREKAAANLIEDHLDGVEIHVQPFRNAVPRGKAELEADGKKIECLPSAFVSGKVNEKCLISSVHVSARYFSDANINFNLYCDEISLATFYFAPSVAVRKEDVPALINAETVNGKVSIKRELFVSRNLLVGNLEKPRYILFSHYDTVLNGAIDNSSGTALCMELIRRFPELLKDVLIVFSGSEELSFDKPVYWGKGYRVFEEEYLSALKNCKRIVVVDCVGFAPPDFIKNYMMSAFPIKNLEKFEEKTFLLSVKEKYFSKLWEVYHSKLDGEERINEKHMQNAMTLLLSFLRGERF